MPNDNDATRLPGPLVAGHKQFLQNAFPANERLFARLADEQRPKVMWIGCSDSRVPPELILGAEPGELFILRNVANMVPPGRSGERSVAAAIAFAVEQLRIDDIVICGHSDCGGVKALAAGPLSNLNPMVADWIQYARPALEEVGPDDLPRLIKTHAAMQTERLMEYDCVRDAVEAGQLALHACYYDIASGRLEQHDPVTREWKPVAS